MQSMTAAIAGGFCFNTISHNNIKMLAVHKAFNYHLLQETIF